MRRYVAEATRRQGPTGTNLLQILEQRLDAVVAPLGLAHGPAKRSLTER